MKEEQIKEGFEKASKTAVESLETAGRTESAEDIEKALVAVCRLYAMHLAEDYGPNEPNERSPYPDEWAMPHVASGAIELIDGGGNGEIYVALRRIESAFVDALRNQAWKEMKEE